MVKSTSQKPRLAGRQPSSRRWGAPGKDRAALEHREQDLLTRLRVGLADIERIHQLTLFGVDHPRVGIATFAVADLDSYVVARRLADERGIGVRDGLFCAHPLTRRLLTAHGPDLPATAVRASLGVATTAEHVGRLITGVAHIAAR